MYTLTSGGRMPKKPLHTTRTRFSTLTASLNPWRGTLNRFGRWSSQILRTDFELQDLAQFAIDGVANQIRGAAPQDLPRLRPQRLEICAIRPATEGAVTVLCSASLGRASWQAALLVVRCTRRWPRSSAARCWPASSTREGCGQPLCGGGSD